MRIHAELLSPEFIGFVISAAKIKEGFLFL
jgi:hypothetical protein